MNSLNTYYEKFCHLHLVYLVVLFNRKWWWFIWVCMPVTLWSVSSLMFQSPTSPNEKNACGSGGAWKSLGHWCYVKALCESIRQMWLHGAAALVGSAAGGCHVDWENGSGETAMAAGCVQAASITRQELNTDLPFFCMKLCWEKWLGGSCIAVSASRTQRQWWHCVHSVTGIKTQMEHHHFRLMNKTKWRWRRQNF